MTQIKGSGVIIGCVGFGLKPEAANARPQEALVVAVASAGSQGNENPQPGSSPHGSTKSSTAYLLLERLRTQGLAGTELERATAGSLRLKLLKVAAQVRVSVRRVYVQLSSSYPLQSLFRLCQARLMRLVPATG